MDETTASMTEFIDALGLTKGRGSQLKHMGLPMTPDGRRVRLEAAKTWYGERIHKSATKRGPRSSKSGLPKSSPGAEMGKPASLRLLESQADKERALATLRQLEVGRRKGELLDASDVERVWTKALLGTRNRLLQLPGKLAPHMVGLTSPIEAQEIIRKEIYQALTTLAEDPFGKEKKKRGGGKPEGKIGK
jgi:hypothetical protein